MKNILLSTVAFVGLTAGAMAADLPMRAAPPAPMPVAIAPAFTWTGFYVGVNGGVAFQDDNNDRNRNRRGGGDDSSILGGGQIGYNMQFGMFVAGIEADIQAIDFERINPRLANGNNNNGNNANNNRNNEDEVDVFGTVRGRLGLAAFDRGLIYATGGLAWKSDEGNNGGGRNNGGGNGSENIGFTVGGGVEYAFTNNISLKVEGLYVDFSEDKNGRNRRNNNNVNNINFTGNGAREFGLVRAGLNFRFNTF
jgi:outer membrane immunogenic protein